MSTPPLEPKPKQQVNPVLAGLVAGILLFAAMMCTASLALMPRLGEQLNVLPESGETWTPPAEVPTPPEPTPTLEPLDSPADDSSSGNAGVLKIGANARNVNDGPVNMRRTPGYIEKPVTDRIALVPAGAIVVIIAGPEPVDGLEWWQVRWEGQEGWMAQNRASGPAILAPLEENP